MVKGGFTMESEAIAHAPTVSAIILNSQSEELRKAPPVKEHHTSVAVVKVKRSKAAKPDKVVTEKKVVTPKATATRPALTGTSIPKSVMKVIDASDALANEPIFKPGDDVDTMRTNAGSFIRTSAERLFERATKEQDARLEALVDAEYRPSERVKETSECDILRSRLNIVG
jgi:hypothetical protein